MNVLITVDDSDTEKLRWILEGKMLRICNHVTCVPVTKWTWEKTDGEK